MTILDQIEAADFEVFRHRPSLRIVDKVRMVLRSAVRLLPGRDRHA